jgi:hypothetical protein
MVPADNLLVIMKDGSLYKNVTDKLLAWPHRIAAE